jgi:hypothetical protein
VVDGSQGSYKGAGGALGTGKGQQSMASTPLISTGC